MDEILGRQLTDGLFGLMDEEELGKRGLLSERNYSNIFEYGITVSKPLDLK